MTCSGAGPQASFVWHDRYDDPHMRYRSAVEKSEKIVGSWPEVGALKEKPLWYTAAFWVGLGLDQTRAVGLRTDSLWVVWGFAVPYLKN